MTYSGFTDNSGGRSFHWRSQGFPLHWTSSPVQLATLPWCGGALTSHKFLSTVLPPVSPAFSSTCWSVRWMLRTVPWLLMRLLFCYQGKPVVKLSLFAGRIVVLVDNRSPL